MEGGKCPYGSIASATFSLTRARTRDTPQTGRVTHVPRGGESNIQTPEPSPSFLLSHRPGRWRTRAAVLSLASAFAVVDQSRLESGTQNSRRAPFAVEENLGARDRRWIGCSSFFAAMEVPRRAPFSLVKSREFSSNEFEGCVVVVCCRSHTSHTLSRELGKPKACCLLFLSVNFDDDIELQAWPEKLVHCATESTTDLTGGQTEAKILIVFLNSRSIWFGSFVDWLYSVPNFLLYVLAGLPGTSLPILIAKGVYMRAPALLLPAKSTLKHINCIKGSWGSTWIPCFLFPSVWLHNLGSNNNSINQVFWQVRHHLNKGKATQECRIPAKRLNPSWPLAGHRRCHLCLDRWFFSLCLKHGIVVMETKTDGWSSMRY